jgi:hypothetical protein
MRVQACFPFPKRYRRLRLLRIFSQLLPNFTQIIICLSQQKTPNNKAVYKKIEITKLNFDKRKSTQKVRAQSKLWVVLANSKEEKEFEKAGLWI